MPYLLLFPQSLKDPALHTLHLDSGLCVCASEFLHLGVFAQGTGCYRDEQRGLLK